LWPYAGFGDEIYFPIEQFLQLVSQINKLDTNRLAKADHYVNVTFSLKVGSYNRSEKADRIDMVLFTRYLIVMKFMGAKVRLIYYPFLLISIMFMLCYSLLNIWLTMDTAILPFKEELADMWIPMFLPAIPLIIWLRPRIGLASFKTKRSNNLPFLYLMVACFAIAIPSIILQDYLRKATGKLTALSSISQIRQNKPTKYYTAKFFYVDTARAAVKNIAKISGKNNETLNWTIFIACPMFDERLSGTEALPQAWACMKYQEHLSSRLDPSVRREKWKAFASASLNDFAHEDFIRTTYFDRIGNNEDRGYYEKDILDNPFITAFPAPLLMLEPRYTAFEARTGHKLAWAFGAYAIGAGIWLLMLVFPKLDTTVAEAPKESLREKKAINNKGIREAVALLIPRQGYAAVPLILDLNLLVFVTMIIAGKGFVNFQAADLLAWGGNFRPQTAGEGEWWRLLTNIFLHAGIMHLLFNMVGLLFAGIFLESTIGTMRLAAAYLVTGITASVASIWWHPSTVSVGASGAIFGLFGVFLALLSTRYFPPVLKKSLTIGVVIFVGGNLLVGLAQGIDNAAHVGGLLCGLVIGYIYYPRLKLQKIIPTSPDLAQGPPEIN
jgi:rhomboid protease GluP